MGKTQQIRMISLMTSVWRISCTDQSMPFSGEKLFRKKCPEKCIKIFGIWLFAEVSESPRIFDYSGYFRIWAHFPLTRCKRVFRDIEENPDSPSRQHLSPDSGTPNPWGGRIIPPHEFHESGIYNFRTQIIFFVTKLHHICSSEIKTHDIWRYFY